MQVLDATEDKVAAEDDSAENGLELSPPKEFDLLMLFLAKRGTFVGGYLIGAAKASALLEVFRPAFVNDKEKDEDERLKVEMNTMILSGIKKRKNEFFIQ